LDRKYYLEDGLGNIRYVMDATTNNIQTYEYDAFGNNIAGGPASKFQYKGEELDDKTGLYFMRARYYDPTTGGFISRDPVNGHLANPQSQNGYNYANANPVNLSDPSGEGPEIIAPIAGFFWVGLGIGGAIGGGQNYLQNGSDCTLGGFLGAMGSGANTALSSDVGQTAALITLLAPSSGGSKSNAIQSTGRNIATNPNEEAAMAKAMANPSGGFKIPIELGDPRWPASGGWVKMTQNINGIEIHYNLNEITKETADWKFK
jgi:RHS repeat-associated protein